MAAVLKPRQNVDPLLHARDLHLQADATRARVAARPRGAPAGVATESTGALLPARWPRSDKRRPRTGHPLQRRGRALRGGQHRRYS
jgi:hypothetical protein